MSNPLVASLSIFFDTPPSVAAAGASGSIADRVAERNGRGQFVIPGSQVKGKVRHACEQVLGSAGFSICESPRAATMCPNHPATESICAVCRIFGNPSARSPLHFHDLVARLDLGQDSSNLQASLRSMVSINRRRGTASDKRLFMVETAPYLPELEFVNERAITGRLDSSAQASVLLAGLKLITAWGGMKSRGVGWMARLEARITFDGKILKDTNFEEVRALCSDSR
jgi:CRISPR/Cas system CSM-associated protein Csm3 (group 7 of RAMP superfamily)